MPHVQFYLRRLFRVPAHPAAQLVAISFFLWFCVSWMVEHNHDDNGSSSALARPTTSVENPKIDWSTKYYVQYVTSPEYLCNALMLWSQVEEIGSRAQSWDANEVDPASPSQELSSVARLLQTAQKAYYVKLYPIELIHHNTTESTWSASLTKLLVFNLTQFSTIVYLDSDSLYLQNLDELFLLPKAPVAMPWVYWGPSQGWSFSSQLMVIRPSTEVFAMIEKGVREAGPSTYDMDLIHSLFPPSETLRLPARPYNLISGEFRLPNHQEYLGSHPLFRRRRDVWNPTAALAEAKFLHFSDWPVPKPWMRASREVLNKYMPKCKKTEWFGASDCLDRSTWLGLYGQFALRRKAVCGKGFELQEAVLPENSVFKDGKWRRPDEVV